MFIVPRVCGAKLQRKQSFFFFSYEVGQTLEQLPKGAVESVLGYIQNPAQHRPGSLLGEGRWIRQSVEERGLPVLTVQ